MRKIWKPTVSTFRFFDTFKDLQDLDLSGLVESSDVVEYKKGSLSKTDIARILGVSRVALFQSLRRTEELTAIDLSKTEVKN